MGYYTRFSLQIFKENKKLEEISYIMNELFKYRDVELALNADGSSHEDTKWYGHEENMIKFSKKYPDLTFHLRGQGEEPEDRWLDYYKNGKRQSSNLKLIEQLEPCNL